MPSAEYSDDVGAFLYSLAPAEVQREGHELTSGNVHEHLSELTWRSDGRHVAVMDRHGSQASLVVAEPKGEGGARVWRAPVPELGVWCTAADVGRHCRPFRPVLLQWHESAMRATVDELDSKRGASVTVVPARWLKLSD